MGVDEFALPDLKHPKGSSNNLCGWPLSLLHTKHKRTNNYFLSLHIKFCSRLIHGKSQRDSIIDQVTPAPTPALLFRCVFLLFSLIFFS